MKNNRKFDYIYTYKKVRRKGRIDGKGFKWKFWPFVKETREVRPPLDQEEPAQFEKELYKVGEQELRSLSESWEELDRKLKNEYCLAANNLKKAKESFNKENSEAKEAKDAFEIVNQEYHKIGKPSLSPSWMIFWLIFFGIAEFPINSMVFQTLGENFWFTLLLAVGLCVAIPFAAHYLGKSIRQEFKTKAERVFIVLLPIIIIALLAVIGVLRTTFFEAVQNNIKWLHLNISPNTLTILFIVINLTIFFVALLVSYQGSHPKHDEYQNLKVRYKNALRSLLKESSEAELAARILAKAESCYQTKNVIREKYHTRYAERAKFIIKKVETHMEIYRSFNLESRKSAGKPICFNKPLMELIISENLLPDNLNWVCPEHT